MKLFIKELFFLIPVALILIILIDDVQGNIDVNKCNELVKCCSLTNSGCVNSKESYNCTCESETILEKKRYVDVNECNELAKFCNLANSDCVKTNGSYNCTCKSGWILKNNSCVDVNECNELAKYCNFPNSDCENTNGSYNCTCKSGWILENNSCVDVNECNELAKFCNLTNSDCVNTNGSYNCTCKSGWILGNNSCVDVNECNEVAKFCNLANSDCVNTNGSYNCTCKSGWILENNSCVDINECDSLIDNCNLTNKVCVNSIGSYYCYKGEWSTWSECSVTCGSGYKYSIFNPQFKSQQEAKRSVPCINTKCSVDGNWSNWTTDESCSNSLCICSIRLERYCNNPAPADGGYDCLGLNVRYLENNKICQVNGGWTQWSLWSLCSQPCQDGVKTTYRSCSNPLPKYGGLPCNGSNTDEKTCSLNKCNNVTVNFSIIFTDEDYDVNKPLEDKIKTAIQNVYKKFNKTVPFNLKLNSIKSVKSYLTNP
ncbi:latent-transforming growth factor beta-binding protein 1-like [Hydra vulgaris]|uniref:Latent-transforming growth factor beta-binding protein 1-like n=1 Tax=Hydra vulgaris TaxID=6087 RepID=A0ABM4DQ10_HYDVU